MDDFSYIEFSYGKTPVDVLSKRLPDFYPMTLVGEDAQAVSAVVNIGIDSHLQACYVPDRGDSFKSEQQPIRGVCLVCNVSRESMLVLIRRLEEAGDQGDDNAMDMRSCILSTLDIGEI